GGDVGEGQLADPSDIVAAAAGGLGPNHLARRRGRVSPGGRPVHTDSVRASAPAGGPRKPIDGVRIITNRSSGKQGYAIAEVAARRGADVTLVTTIGRAAPSRGEIGHGPNASDMQDAVMGRAPTQDVIVMAAAVADF